MDLLNDQTIADIVEPQPRNPTPIIQIDRKLLRSLRHDLPTQLVIEQGQESLIVPLIPLDPIPEIQLYSQKKNYELAENALQYYQDSFKAWTESLSDPICALSTKLDGAAELQSALDYNLMALRHTPHEVTYKLNLAYIYSKALMPQTVRKILEEIDSTKSFLWLHQKFLYLELQSQLAYNKGLKGDCIYWSVQIEQILEKIIFPIQIPEETFLYYTTLVGFISCNLFALMSDYTFSPIKLKEVIAQTYGKLAPSEALRYTHKPHQHKKMRIGYVSGDFCLHPVGTFILPLLAAHDRNKFEIYCYYNSSASDQTTTEISALADKWAIIDKLNPIECAQLIYSDEIDILVDLAGITSKNSLSVFALKPAPIQVTYLGYASTTGIEQIDYKLVDQWTDLESDAPFYTEKLIRLPHGMHTYRSVAVEKNILSAHRKTGPIIFGSFAGLHKLHPELISRWIDILKRVPDSRLMLKLHDLPMVDSVEWIENMFLIGGLSLEKLQIITSVASVHDHLFLYNRTDICLDAWPYSGTTTSCDALSMNVPIIAYYGRCHLERVTSSFLHQIGHSELIAYTWDEYIQKAVELALDRPRLEKYHTSLRETFRSSTLCDARTVTCDIETAFSNMWEKYNARMSSLTS